MSHETYFDGLVRKAETKRQKEAERRRRRMELGYDGWQKMSDGSFYQQTPKRIQNWYDTRTLITKVTEAFERNGGVCYINKKWCLQIRGKHLRRLLKAMPYVKQIGNKLVDT